MDFVSIRGNEAAKRAMLIAIAGGHSITLIGRSGNGKTMLAEAARYASYAAGVPVPKIVESLHGKEGRDFSPEARATDMQCEVASVPFRELIGSKPGTSTADILRQLGRGKPNDDMSLDETCIGLLKAAYDELGLSARAYFAAIRVARTIANLDPSDKINVNHIAEAVQYQLISRQEF